MYVERPDGSLRFQWVKAPTSAEATHLTHTLAHRIGRFLERRGLLERDAENSYLASDDFEAGPMERLPACDPRQYLGPRAAARTVVSRQWQPGCLESTHDTGQKAGQSSQVTRPFASGPTSQPFVQLCT